MSFIERIGEKRVGFYCWKLFVINYFRGYEVRLIINCCKISSKYNFI